MTKFKVGDLITGIKIKGYLLDYDVTNEKSISKVLEIKRYKKLSVNEKKYIQSIDSNGNMLVVLIFNKQKAYHENSTFFVNSDRFKKITKEQAVARLL